MQRNVFQEMADQLGWMAYLFVMSGGRPDLSLLTLRPPADPPEEQGEDLRKLLDTTVPLEVGREREDAAA